MTRKLLTIADCKTKILPQDKDIESAMRSIRGNPANKPAIRTDLRKTVRGLLTPAHIAAMTSRLWPTTGVNLTVSFPFDSTDRATQQKIVEFANHWGTQGRGNVKFSLTSDKAANVRIITQTNDGYWSYIGRDIEQVPTNEPTMTLSEMSVRSTPDSEFYRVVEHEFGHTLGFMHEHERPSVISLFNPAGVYKWAEETQGWDKQTVDEQILTPLNEALLTATSADTKSVMEYDFPGTWNGVNVTKNGQPIISADQIDSYDAQLVANLYPQPVKPLPPVSPPPISPPVSPPPVKNPWQVAMAAYHDVIQKLMIAPYNWPYWRAISKATQFLGFMYNEANRNISELQIVRDVLSRIKS